MIMLENRAEYILSWLGYRHGRIGRGAHQHSVSRTFFEHQVRTVMPTGAIVGANFVERFIESAEACSRIRNIYVIGSASDVLLSISALEDAGFAAEPFDVLMSSPVIALPHVESRDLASVFFTSGTTGLSKGVTMTHAHMVFEADECISLTRLSDVDTYLSVGPLFHGNAQFLAAYPALLAGARFVLRERFSASRWAAGFAIRKQQ